MFNKQAIYQLLDDKNISYKKLEHNPVYTIEDMKDEGILDQGIILKNLFLRNAKGDKHYLVSTYEDTKIDLKKLPKMIESTRLSFASPERLKKHLKLNPGSVSPLGLLNDESKEVEFIFDKSVSPEEEIGIHPNENTATIWLKRDDLINLIKENGNSIKFVSFNQT